MITLRKGKFGTELRFEGDADELKAEIAIVLVNGCVAISEKDNKKDIEDNFAAMLLTSIDMMEDKGVRFDSERFKKALDMKKAVNMDDVFKGLEKIFNGIKEGKPNG